MHGTTMVFLLGMPLAAAFGNYLVPLMIGARDVAFPRLNMLGFWVFAVRRAVHLLVVRARRRARRRLVRLRAAHEHADRRRATCPGRGADFWAVGLIMLGIGSVATAVNFIVTDPQHARAGHDDDADAGVRVDDAGGRVPHAVRDAAASPPR